MLQNKQWDTKNKKIKKETYLGGIPNVTQQLKRLKLHYTNIKKTEQLKT